MNSSDAEAAKLYLEYVKTRDQLAGIKGKLKGTAFWKVVQDGKAVKGGGVKKAKKPKAAGSVKKTKKK